MYQTIGAYFLVVSCTCRNTFPFRTVEKANLHRSLERIAGSAFRLRNHPEADELAVMMYCRLHKLLFCSATPLHTMSHSPRTSPSQPFPMAVYTVLVRTYNICLEPLSTLPRLVVPKPKLRSQLRLKIVCYLKPPCIVVF